MHETRWEGGRTATGVPAPNLHRFILNVWIETQRIQMHIVRAFLGWLKALFSTPTAPPPGLPSRWRESCACTYNLSAHLFKMNYLCICLGQGVPAQSHFHHPFLLRPAFNKTPLGASRTSASPADVETDYGLSGAAQDWDELCQGHITLYASFAKPFQESLEMLPP